jgi:hypothetical protein
LPEDFPHTSYFEQTKTDSLTNQRVINAIK